MEVGGGGKRGRVCTCARVVGQAGGVKGRFPNHLLWSFPEMQSTLENLEADTRLPTSFSAQIQAAGLPQWAPHKPGTGSGRTEVLLSTGSCGPRPSFPPNSSPRPLPRSHWVVWEV